MKYLAIILSMFMFIGCFPEAKASVPEKKYWACLQLGKLSPDVAGPEGGYYWLVISNIQQSEVLPGNVREAIFDKLVADKTYLIDRFEPLCMNYINEKEAAKDLEAKSDKARKSNFNVYQLNFSYEDIINVTQTNEGS